MEAVFLPRCFFFDLGWQLHLLHAFCREPLRSPASSAATLYTG
jgi:hypothetical protein